jgi:superfamily I DNA/RNA helicase
MLSDCHLSRAIEHYYPEKHEVNFIPWPKAGLKMHGFKCAGRKTRNFYFEVDENEQDKFEGLGGVHVTTFKSSKGTEFETVIIPDFDSYTWNLSNSKVINENDYYVAFTRAKTNLFLICKDKLFLLPPF